MDSWSGLRSMLKLERLKAAFRCVMSYVIGVTAIAVPSKLALSAGEVTPQTVDWMTDVLLRSTQAINLATAVGGFVIVYLRLRGDLKHYRKNKKVKE